ncbi:MAG: universal stress protein [Bdellovibrionaceae bacterium]|nr:universal stress protein [Pseudobdellovibrionaceae bacterium]
MSLNIFWAFDPFDESGTTNKTAAQVLRWISKPINKQSDAVHAVYVTSPVQMDFAPLSGVPMMSGLAAGSQVDLKKDAEAKIKSLKAKELKSAALKSLVLESATSSLTDTVRTFADHVSRQRGDLILVSTHARKGMPRFVLGSFAETLVHFAKTDILLFHPQAEVGRARPTRLLYAHDFKRSGDIGFRRALEYARHWGAKLDVVHIPRPSYSVKFEGEDKSVQTYRRGVKAKIHKIEKELAAAGVTGSVSILTKWAPMVSMLLKAANQRKSDMIIMTAQTGRFAALLGGSVTRGVMRQSSLPTLVLKI